MPYFDLDPENTLIQDLWGCITFHEDPDLAAKYAIREQISWHGEVIRELIRSETIANALWQMKEIYPDTPDWDPQEGEKKLWRDFKKAIERYGGLPAMADLVDDFEFPNLIIKTDMEQGLVGHILTKALEIHRNGLPVVKEKLFKLIEESARHGLYKDIKGKAIQFPASRNSLYRAWRKHSSIAHWIAATFYLQSFVDEDGETYSEINPFAPLNTIIFGAYADHYLGLGSQITTRTQTGRSQPFLNPDKAWRLPPSFALPKSDAHKQLYLRFPTLEDWELDILGIS